MNASKTISNIQMRWSVMIWLKILLSSLLTIGAVALVFQSEASYQTYILIGILAFLSSYLLFRKNLPTFQKVIVLANQQIPKLEYSTSLVYENEVSGLARVQQERVNVRLREQIPNLKFPTKYMELIWVFLVALFLSLSSYWLHQQSNKIPKSESGEILSTDSAVQNSNPNGYQVSIKIRPPEYTGLKTRQSSNYDLASIPLGSVVSWSFDFDQTPISSWLNFSDGDSIPGKTKTSFSIKKRADRKGFYTFNYIDQDSNLIVSNYFQFEVIPDKPPMVVIEGVPQYQSFLPGEQDKITFQAKTIDDYGLADVYIIATITKGSGESVKFREERLSFKQTPKGKTFNSQMTLTTDQFEMEPGNELYFYLEAKDNDNPPKSSKTETFFFILEDTAEMAFSLEGDLGVDLMPEYFRSQRQIIIDSEKILAERKAGTISKEEFNQRSNELGFDQKVLRLKYGQFIGEEADSGIEIENEIDEPDFDKPGEVDVLSEFGHDTDHENEEGQLMDKGTEQHPDVVEEMSHSHDDRESATFFEESMKSKLKSALSEMWNAELYLRLFKPEESLPYQYKALELIKEIKNHARIYVHRIGFDPPPINEVKSRLSGDLEGVEGDSYQIDLAYQQKLPEVRNLINAISDQEKRLLPIDNSLSSQLQRAGNEIAYLAIENPGSYLQLLTEIRKISEMQQFNSLEILTNLKSQLVNVLPVVVERPGKSKQPQHELLNQFIQTMLQPE